MIHVVAEIELKPGKRQEFLEILQKHVLKVRQEKGCIAYAPMVDVASSPIGNRPPREAVVTILEQWESAGALKAHSQAPHQVEFFKATQAFRVSGRVAVLEEA